MGVKGLINWRLNADKTKKILQISDKLILTDNRHSLTWSNIIDICIQKEEHSSLGDSHFKCKIRLIMEFPVIRLTLWPSRSAGLFQ